jgi:hypothetical protein
LKSGKEEVTAIRNKCFDLQKKIKNKIWRIKKVTYLCTPNRKIRKTKKAAQRMRGERLRMKRRSTQQRKSITAMVRRYKS